MARRSCVAHVHLSSLSEKKRGASGPMASSVVSFWNGDPNWHIGKVAHTTGMALASAAATRLRTAGVIQIDACSCASHRK
jgi:hypothetical protein